MADKSETIVIVEEKAFMGMFLAAVEAFPTRFRPGKSRRPKGTSPEGEVFGLLLGQRTTRKNNLDVFNVTLAVPNQIIYGRSAGGVTASGTHIDYIRELTKIFPAYQFLGTFHSHPYKRKNFHPTTAVEHSDGDERSAIAMAEATGTSLLEIIFGLTCCSRRAKPLPVAEPHLVHGCSGLYMYTIGCYCAEHNSDTGEGIFRAVDNLVCPDAI